MGAKPSQVRLVSKKQYRRVMQKRAGAYLTAFGAICFGVACLGMGRWIIPHLRDAFPGVLFFGGLGLIGILGGKLLLRDARKIEPVTLLTTQNARYAPDKKVLMRGSEHPNAEAQKELLRPAQSGKDTPAEQLLRATQTDATE